MSLGKLLKDIILPVAIGTTGGGFLSGIGVENPFIQRALLGGASTKLLGGKSKDAVRNALLSGIGGAFFDSAGQQTPVERTNVRSTPTVEKLPVAMTRSDQTIETGSSTVPTETATKGIAEAFKPKTFSAELLKSAGVGGDNLLARLLNTRLGEGLTAGLIAQLLAGDDDEEQEREFQSRQFGFGGPGGKLGGITYRAEGGPMNFPRRTGGIDPSEGSGTKDDVPAMLMAGEFVLTKDAVKGLGDGNQRKGIQRAYDMMSNLEARA